MTTTWEQRILDGIAFGKLPKLPNAARLTWSMRVRRKVAGALIRLADRIHRPQPAAHREHVHVALGKDAGEHFASGIATGDATQEGLRIADESIRRMAKETRDISAWARQLFADHDGAMETANRQMSRWRNLLGRLARA